MKELNGFTVERLEGLIGDAETWSFVKVPARELKALARIALAAKRAEPVSLESAIAKFKEYNIGFPVEKLKADFVISWCLTNLSPQLNSQVPLSSWINCIDQMPEDDQVVVIINSGHGFLYEAAVVTRRGPHFDLMDGLEASNYDGGAVVRLDMEATHWMQLPAAPAKENG
ncbi:DUF551 domain-containing protein [Yersinia intermedia]|uniref:DUF551 domain-containing protein n=1 Tax=Yersinia intermedia TaxID=631 RepID=UPI0011802C34|nr:DUF551 domain-containing protein [Yersinia intermedia]